MKVKIKEHTSYSSGHGYIIIEQNGNITKDSSEPAKVKIFPTLEEAQIFCKLEGWKF